MKIKYLILITVLLIFSAVVLSCKKGQTTSTPQSGGTVTSTTESNPLEEEIEKIPEIEVNQSHVTIGVGDKFTLTARADNVENASFLWNVDINNLFAEGVYLI